MPSGLATPLLLLDAVVRTVITSGTFGTPPCVLTAAVTLHTPKESTMVTEPLPLTGRLA